MMGPIAAGIIYERLHAYDVAYYFGGGSCILASLILLIFYPKMFICEKYKEVYLLLKVYLLHRVKFK